MAKKKPGCLRHVAAVLLMLVCGFFLIDSCVDRMSRWEMPDIPVAAPWHEQENLLAAYMAAQDFVAARVPSPLRWPDMQHWEDMTTAEGEQTYTVRSWVNSNTTRRWFRMRVQQQREGEWTLLEISGL